MAASSPGLTGWAGDVRLGRRDHERGSALKSRGSNKSREKGGAVEFTIRDQQGWPLKTQGL